MSEHTLGKWVADRPESDDSGAYHIYVVRADGELTPKVAEAYTHRRACLIAAEPGLLRALRVLIAGAAESYDENGGEGLIAGIDQARAAIKRATP